MVDFQLGQVAVYLPDLVAVDLPDRAEAFQLGRAGGFQPDRVEACLQGLAVGAQRAPVVGFQRGRAAAAQRALAETLTHGTAPTPTAKIEQGSALLNRRHV